ncbi:M48 family metalloprotease [Sphingomonas mesophila]|uniref:M48 family metalloprotease n=1 Tax=Sphingomonas mesophila TaxID=2303576 RepID=UPI000E58E304|nr:M48 family metalloprotease [Sphingomonas mesophila]
MKRRLLALAASAAVIVPAAAIAQARYLNPRDVAEAQRQHPELVQEFGGAESGTRGAYVQQVGARVAAQTGVVNSGQAFRFTTLNSAVENAFAVPGGYIYITRQLMALLDDESELAFVLGHEAGHVAGNHAQARKSAATRNSVLGVLGAILGSVVGNSGLGSMIGQSAMRYSQMATLSFSREQEYQADSLGTRYITRAGYDPLGGTRVLAALTRSSALETRLQGHENRSTPEWASTHPLSTNRLQRALVEAQRSGPPGQGVRNRDQFLNVLDGMYVDDDPAQGVIEGRVFSHPDLLLQFAVPPTYRMQNSASAVTISGSAGQAQFSGGRYQGPLEQYIMRVVQGLTGGRQQVAMAPPRQTMINGIPAMYSVGRANTSSGSVDVSVMAYRWSPDTVYHFVMLTRGGQGIGPFTQMVDSLRRLSGQEAAAIRPKVIDVVTVRAGDTVQSLSQRMAYRDYRLERFVALNGIAPNERLVPGSKVKLVIYGARRSG